MILDTISKVVEVILGGAITTNQLEYTADYVDTANGLSFAPGATNGVTNGGTLVVMVPAPAASIQRQVKSITIYNADTVSATVTVRQFDGTNRRHYIVVTLAPGQSLVFTPEGGWSVQPLAPASTAQLSDYASLPWTPVDASGAGLAFSSVDAEYVKIGNMVTAWAAFTYPSTVDATQVKLGGFPFNFPNRNLVNFTTLIRTGVAAVHGLFPVQNSSTANIFTSAGAGTVTNATYSSKLVGLQISYPVA